LTLIGQALISDAAPEERTQAFLKRVIEAGRAADLTATEPG
jgi:hypothetical protein